MAAEGRVPAERNAFAVGGSILPLLAVVGLRRALRRLVTLILHPQWRSLASVAILAAGTVCSPVSALRARTFSVTRASLRAVPGVGWQAALRVSRGVHNHKHPWNCLCHPKSSAPPWRTRSVRVARRTPERGSAGARRRRAASGGVRRGRAAAYRPARVFATTRYRFASISCWFFIGSGA